MEFLGQRRGFKRRWEETGECVIVGYESARDVRAKRTRVRDTLNAHTLISEETQRNATTVHDPEWELSSTARGLNLLSMVRKKEVILLPFCAIKRFYQSAVLFKRLPLN